MKKLQLLLAAAAAEKYSFPLPSYFNALWAEVGFACEALRGLLCGWVGSRRRRRLCRGFLGLRSSPYGTGLLSVGVTAGLRKAFVQGRGGEFGGCALAFPSGPGRVPAWAS